MSECAIPYVGCGREQWHGVSGLVVGLALDKDV